MRTIAKTRGLCAHTPPPLDTALGKPLYYCDLYMFGLFSLYPINVKTKKPIDHFFVDCHSHMTQTTANGLPKLEYFAQK